MTNDRFETFHLLLNKHYTILNDNCLYELKTYCEFKTLLTPQTLVREGQYARNVYFILKGCGRAYYLKDGKDISDWFAFENEFFTPVNSFFLDVPSPHYIEMLEPSELVILEREHVQKLADKYHDFERLIRIVVTKSMLQLQQRIMSVQFETATQKYENLLKTYPDILRRIPLTHIASFLGITLETLSRIRHPQNKI